MDITGSYDPNLPARTFSEDCDFRALGHQYLVQHHFQIDDPNNVLHAIDTRCDPKYAPVLKSDTYQKFGKAYQYIIERWFSAGNIARAVEEVYTELSDASCGLELFKSGKMSTADFLKAIDENQITDDDGVLRAFLKKEIINKIKNPRIIQNEGRNVLVRHLLGAVVFERILFGYTHGSNIKHMTRDDMIKMITRRCSSFPSCETEAQIVEIDQTSFDISETCRPFKSKSYELSSTDRAFVGLLSYEVELLARIDKGLTHLPENATAHLNIKKRQKSSKFVIGTKLGNVTVDLRQRVRHSGDRYTSSGNFLVEFLSSLSVFCDDPCRVLEQYHWYGTSALPPDRYCTVDGKNRRMRIFVEGDDGLLQFSSKLPQPATFYMDRFHDLGLDTKLLFISSGLATFCGVRMPIKNGYTAPNIGCPDIIRALGKLGSVRKTLTDADAAACLLARATELPGGMIYWLRCT